MKIYSIEVFNLNTTGVFYGEAVPKGCLGVVVDKFKFDKYYEICDGIFVAECDGLVHCYEHKKGTAEGFAGCTIVLPVFEKSVVFNKKAIRRRVFNGSLWNTVNAKHKAQEYLNTKLFGIGIRESCYEVYSGALATETFMQRIAKVVIVGEAQQSPLI
ncbi:hypothetical protein CE143_20015 [Photorhabdus luminescens]|uniref:Uncharacterized protein n=1 Tax=Photorhabdus akhurstii TaxID=171438 RepID=A0ABX8LY76_9GAMM|nr:hypothetical protein [Photorhabdus akhurstii]QXF35197.1 hypothetical protein B0X70_19970 [Photorhabdus akhurstii]UJD77030.1 hypothetical protein CE143_20015 [Photorhabdus luminescens]